jgi:hypothetical protein
MARLGILAAATRLWVSEAEGGKCDTAVTGAMLSCASSDMLPEEPERCVDTVRLSTLARGNPWTVAPLEAKSLTANLGLIRRDVGDVRA